MTFYVGPRYDGTGSKGPIHRWRLLQSGFLLQSFNKKGFLQEARKITVDASVKVTKRTDAAEKPKKT